jgi:signal transduction histidine kinase
VRISRTVKASKFSVKRVGREDTLQNHVVDEIFCIAREALTNAFRYADASKIEVELDYNKREFRTSCRDNGRGVDLRAVRGDGANGHWGLRGMEERAERIGAQFSRASSEGKGTQVQVVVPERRAYIRRRPFLI